MAKVLIVDDDKTLALDLSHTVSGWGYDVRVAETVSGALEAVKDWLPDVILCDLNLPDGSGMDIMKFVNLVNSEVLSVTFLFVSSEPATNVVTEALKLGADDYLIKPLDYDVLKARIHGLLSKQAKYEASLNSLSDETAARNGAFFAASLLTVLFLC